MTDVAGSFRDPSGRVYVRDGVLYRRVERAYAPHWDRLESSGLLAALQGEGLLVRHEEVDPAAAGAPDAWKVLRPERVPFVSWPYEWSFGQLQAAALLTLRVQRLALERGMTLKDASAYNVQFVGHRAVLVDTLSFETRREGEPWVAYRQFCQHFLAPLALMATRDVRLGRLLGVHLDGVPLDLAARLLPARAKLRPSLLLHLVLHARAQKRHEGDARRAAGRVSERGLLGILESLESAVRGLAWEPAGTEWADYYDATNYTDAAGLHKREIVSAFLDDLRPRVVWDLGANTGAFTRLATERGALGVAFDVDPAAVERNWREVVRRGEERHLPLVLDLANPSPALGWAHEERDSLLARGPADCVLALALVHHLAIGNNVPLERVADFLARAGRDLVVEFVPKSDSQVRRMLATREDVFPDYTEEGFERAFERRFEIRKAVKVRESERTVYLMSRREAGDAERR